MTAHASIHETFAFHLFNVFPLQIHDALLSYLCTGIFKAILNRQTGVSSSFLNCWEYLFRNSSLIISISSACVLCVLYFRTSSPKNVYFKEKGCVVILQWIISLLCVNYLLLETTIRCRFRCITLNHKTSIFQFKGHSRGMSTVSKVKKHKYTYWSNTRSQILKKKKNILMVGLPEISH